MFLFFTASLDISQPVQNKSALYSLRPEVGRSTKVKSGHVVRWGFQGPWGRLGCISVKGSLWYGQQGWGREFQGEGWDASCITSGLWRGARLICQVEGICHSGCRSRLQFKSQSASLEGREGESRACRDAGGHLCVPSWLGLCVSIRSNA